MTREPISQEIPRRGFVCQDTLPPWGVPMRRKPREQSLGRGPNRYYDPSKRRLFSSGVGEISTQNRYSPLSEIILEIELEHTVEHEEGPRQGFNRIHSKRSPRRVFFRDERSQMKHTRDGLECSTCVTDDYNAYMFDNKINFSSWYFPEYIPYPCVDIDNVDLNCITDDINSDLNLDYYPIFYGGNYTKQLSNKFSRYNNQYFNKQYSLYKICKKFWKSQETPPSCRIVADSSRIGTKGDDINNKPLNNKPLKMNNNNCISNIKDKTKNNSNSNKFIKDINKNIIKNSKIKTINLSGTQQEEHTPQTPSCRIVANSSRIGTNGVIQRSQQEEHTPQTPSCRIVANSSRIGTNGVIQRSQNKQTTNSTENQFPAAE